MPKVIVLPDHIASQIAAGEVVERPSSVVKELLENAVDAGATQIEVAISADCRDLRVADNGSGMEAEDAALAFHRHATSKLRQVEDLWNLNSLGFRGEALPSIASVAKVTCYTRTREAATGHRIQCQDGEISVTETGCAPGTVMEITDLFYNVPARLSFLKKASTEFGHIQEIVQSLALSHPEVSFHLTHAGRTSLRSSGSGALAQAIVETALLAQNQEMCAIDYADERLGLKIKGQLARPPHFRGDRKGILTTVNRRPVRCPVTYKALEYAYSDLIPRGRYPVGVVSIEISPDMVDVNIHPSKKEIKYSRGNDVYAGVQRALMQALRQERLPSSWSGQLECQSTDAEPTEATSPGQSDRWQEELLALDQLPAKLPEVLHSPASFSLSAGSSRTEYDTNPISPHALTVEEERAPHLSSALRGSQLSFRSQLSYPDRTPQQTSDQGHTNALPEGWRLAGYLHDTYIVVETAQGMALIEQHIAHERTLYEQVLAHQNVPGRLSDSNQRLIISVPLQLSAQQKTLVEEGADELARLGFEFEWDADGNVLCTQVPLELAHKEYATVIQTMLEELGSAEATNLDLEASKSIACQAAIKNGMPLSENDIVKLIADWYQTPRRETCPHGRPVMLSFSKDKLFQMFHPA